MPRIQLVCYKCGANHAVKRGNPRTHYHEWNVRERIEYICWRCWSDRVAIHPAPKNRKTAGVCWSGDRRFGDD